MDKNIGGGIIPSGIDFLDGQIGTRIAQLSQLVHVLDFQKSVEFVTLENQFRDCWFLEYLNAKNLRIRARNISGEDHAVDSEQLELPGDSEFKFPPPPASMDRWLENAGYLINGGTTSQGQNNHQNNIPLAGSNSINSKMMRVENLQELALGTTYKWGNSMIFTIYLKILIF